MSADSLFLPVFLAVVILGAAVMGALIRGAGSPAECACVCAVTEHDHPTTVLLE